jgi:hypothetical protein
LYRKIKEYGLWEPSYTTATLPYAMPYFS